MKITSIAFIFLTTLNFVSAQQKNQTATATTNQHSDHIPVSKADLGTFPYFKTFPNSKPRNSSDSLTVEQNQVYFFDGKKFFTVEGKVSAQTLTTVDNGKARPSEFQIIQEFDKIVSTLGGKKIYTGQFPPNLLKPLAGTDNIVSLIGTNQLVNGAYNGVVEYVIKTLEKEVWVQLQPYTIKSEYYSVLIVEKRNQLLSINTNKQNLILQELETKEKAIASLAFSPDAESLLTESKDEILQVVGIFQSHPEWKIKMEIHNAPVGKPDYTLALTQKRAEAIRQELLSLGVKSASIEIKGMGDQKPLATNDTEKGRLANTRVEITRL